MYVHGTKSGSQTDWQDYDYGSYSIGNQRRRTYVATFLRSDEPQREKNPLEGRNFIAGGIWWQHSCCM